MAHRPATFAFLACQRKMSRPEFRDFCNNICQKRKLVGCPFLILLQSSKIEPLRKSRESRFLDASSVARLRRPDTKVCSRLCLKRCGPTRPRVRNTAALSRNFVRPPKGTFATLSASSRHEPPHSITSSARESSAGEMFRLSALAVLRLMTSSNFVGCSIGRSAGFAPLRILST